MLVVSNFLLVLLLTLVIAVNLCCVVVLDAGDEFVEQVDELCGSLVGETRKQEWQDNRAAFHWTSSMAVWTCSEVTCLSLASAAAESA